VPDTILDRLLSSAEFARAPDRFKFGEFSVNASPASRTTDRYRMWSRQRRLSYIFDTIENFLHRAFTLMSAVA
jgi:hypothetical protein